MYKIGDLVRSVRPLWFFQVGTVFKIVGTENLHPFDYQGVDDNGQHILLFKQDVTLNVDPTEEELKELV